MAVALLEIENVSKRFGGVEALKEISLKLEAGEVLAIVGDNGAGKSTLMKCVSGAIAADSGCITFNKQDVTGSPPKTMRDQGVEMIYQNLNLCPQQNVLSNIFLGREETAFGFLRRGAMKQKCQEVFERLDINLPLYKEAGKLSGGQQQSVAIARAILAAPKLMIMDEPTAALAAREVRKVLSLIGKLKNEGIGVVMITHRLGEIFKVADRIIVMRRGEIRYTLLPDETDVKDLTARIVS